MRLFLIIAWRSLFLGPVQGFLIIMALRGFFLASLAMHGISLLSRFGYLESVNRSPWVTVLTAFVLVFSLLCSVASFIAPAEFEETVASVRRLRWELVREVMDS